MWCVLFVNVKRLKLNKALGENSSLSYGTSPAIGDHKVLPATRHKWTRTVLIPAGKLVLDLPTPEGWKAELTYRLLGNAPSLDFVVTRFLLKLFRTVNHDVIRDCCKYLEFSLSIESDHLAKKCDKFVMRYRNCSDLHRYFGIVIS